MAALSTNWNERDKLPVCVTGSGDSRESPLEFPVDMLVVGGEGISLAWKDKIALDK